MPDGVRYTVSMHRDHGRELWFLMRGCIVIARYVDQDVAYRLADALNAAKVAEA